MSDIDPTARLNAALEGRYRIERQLGEGGMATVYLAEDLKHERKVALKVLKPELAAVVGADRFLTEIKTTANLQHPHILGLYDSGEADGLLFYVMPYVEGESLRDRLDREHQLPVDDAVRIATNLAEALDYAHRQGVIHRDIKPANVLLQDGKPVISDFGIALAVDAAGGGRLTETGLSLGTPHYMSPEQATGDLNVGPQTDIYALGCVLYEMLAGEPPFTGSTPQAVLGKIITGQVPSAKEERSSVPPNVDAVILKALEKVPADRFISAGEVERSLSDHSFRHALVVTTEVAGKGPWPLIASLGWLLVVALAVLWWLDTGAVPPSETEVTRLSVLPPKGARLSAAHMTMSPDGRILVYRAAGVLYRRDLETLESTEISGTDAPWMPFFSPDGEWIAFFDVVDNVLERVRPDGSQLQTVVEVPSTVRSGAWGDDGSIVFNSTALGGLMRVSATGGEPREVPGPRVPLGWLDILPGSRAVIGTTTDGISADVVLADLDSGERSVLFPGHMPRFVDGRIVYRLGEALWTVPFDPAERVVRGEHSLLVSGVAESLSTAADFALSRDFLVYRTGGSSNALFGRPLWVDRRGVETPVGLEEGLYAWPSISPDGSKLALTDVTQDIVVYGLERAVLTQLTVDPGEDSAPIWTPDGERVVFRSTRNGASNLYWRSGDASDEVERLTESAHNQRPVAITPDGRTLIFEVFGSGFTGESLWSMALEPGATPSRLIDEGYLVSQASLSPAGDYIVYESHVLGYPEIFIRSYPALAGERMISTLNLGRNTSGANADAREGRSPIWGRHGTEIFYRAGQAMVSVPVQTDGDPSPGRPSELFRTANSVFVGEGRLYDAHPDGTRFITIRRSQAAEAPPNELVIVQNWTKLVGSDGPD